jgi:hypothetical protein
MEAVQWKVGRLARIDGGAAPAAPLCRVNAFMPGQSLGRPITSNCMQTRSSKESVRAVRPDRYDCAVLWTAYLAMIDFEGSRETGIVEFGVTLHGGAITGATTRLCEAAGD